VYYWLKTNDMNILGANTDIDTALKEYDFALHMELKSLCGQLRILRSKQGAVINFLIQEQDAHWVDLLKSTSVVEVDEIPEIFTEKLDCYPE